MMFNVVFMANGYKEVVVSTNDVKNVEEATEKAMDVMNDIDSGDYIVSDYNGDIELKNTTVETDRYVFDFDVSGFRTMEFEALDYDDAYEKATMCERVSFGEIDFIDEDICDVARM